MSDRTAETPDPYLTPTQLAEELELTESTLANWRHQNIGPDYIKLSPGRGGRIRYPRSAVTAWKSSRTADVA